MEITTVHTATLQVPLAAGPEAISIDVVQSPERRMIFKATSNVSEADARRKVREFLQAARDAAQA